MTRPTSRRPGRAALPLLIALSLAGCLSLAGASPSQAQGRAEALSLVVPPVLEVAPSSEAPLSIQIAPEAAAPRRAMVLIRGLPSTVALSEGRLFESGVWSVPAASLAQLKLALPAGSSGRSDLTISVVTLDGTVLAEASASLVIAEPAPAPRIARADPSDNAIFTAAPQQPARPQPAAASADPKPNLLPALTPDARNRLLVLLRKGDDDLRTGNVVNARLLYRHAAEQGLAEGALALAATYDEAELSRLRLRGGVQANPAEARQWYERARELGSAQAQERLQRLGAR